MPAFRSLSAEPPVSGPWLLTGVGGVLGLGLAAMAPRDRELVVAGRRPPAAWRDRAAVLPLDLETPGALARLVAALRPAAVLHAAGSTRLADCTAHPERAWRCNVAAVEELLDALAPGTPLLYVSTDQVFDGRSPACTEEARPRPLHVYGRTKAEAEARVLAWGGTVVRLPLLLGPAAAEGRMGADQALLEALAAGRRPRLFVDEIRTPAAARLLAPWLWELLGRLEGGVFHLAGAEAVSRHELGLRVCAAAGVRPAFDPVRAADLPEAADRPRRLVLDCRRARELLGFTPPDLAQSLARLAGGPPEDPGVRRRSP